MLSGNCNDGFDFGLLLDCFCETRDPCCLQNRAEADASFAEAAAWFSRGNLILFDMPLFRAVLGTNQPRKKEKDLNL